MTRIVRVWFLDQIDGKNYCYFRKPFSPKIFNQKTNFFNVC